MVPPGAGRWPEPDPTAAVAAVVGGVALGSAAGCGVPAVAEVVALGTGLSVVSGALVHAPTKATASTASTPQSLRRTTTPIHDGLRLCVGTAFTIKCHGGQAPAAVAFDRRDLAEGFVGGPTPRRAPPNDTAGSSAPDQDVVQRLSVDRRHRGVVGGKANQDNEKPALLGWATQNLVEKTHRTGRVGQRGQPGPVQRGEQEADGDAY